MMMIITLEGKMSKKKVSVELDKESRIKKHNKKTIKTKNELEFLESSLKPIHKPEKYLNTKTIETYVKQGIIGLEDFEEEFLDEDFSDDDEDLEDDDDYEDDDNRIIDNKIILDCKKSSSLM
jgi:hypothetical protein